MTDLLRIGTGIEGTPRVAVHRALRAPRGGGGELDEVAGAAVERPAIADSLAEVGKCLEIVGVAPGERLVMGRQGHGSLLRRVGRKRLLPDPMYAVRGVPG